MDTPRHGMGGFFARRLSWSTAVSLAGGLGAGLLVDHWPGTEPRHAYVVAFIGAGLAGFASSWFLARVPEPPMAPPSQVRPALLAVLRRPLLDAGFRRLVVFLSSWSFSTNLAAPFLSVYLLQQLGLGLEVVAALWAASQLANGLTVGLWGRLSDRLSDKAVLRCTAPVFLLCLVALPVAAGADGARLPLLVLVHVAMGVATGGTALASGNIALRLAPPGQGTAFLAVVALCSAAAAGIAPVLGGLAADWFAVRELDLVVDWTAPGSSVAVTPLQLRHWEFFFVLAAVTGLYALHSLSRVPGKRDATASWCAT